MTPAAHCPAGPDVSYDFDLGSWTRKVSTSSDACQVWFDRGLNWTFAFNHDEAVACFRRAASEDPSCAMAWWGIAYATGPFMASILDGYAAMGTHVLVRFGRWRALAALPGPDDPSLRPIGVAMHAYGQGVAHAALGHVEEAEAAQCAFDAAAATISEDAIFLSNTVRDMLRIGQAMLEGEVEYRKRNFDHAFASLRLAVARDDALNYTEPWAWMHPPRHALGALLAEQGMYGDAEAAFPADLGYDRSLPRCCQHPDNVWALQGLVECVRQSGDANEHRLLRQRLDFAKARADVPIESACYCRTVVKFPVEQDAPSA